MYLNFISEFNALNEGYNAPSIPNVPSVDLSEASVETQTFTAFYPNSMCVGSTIPDPYGTGSNEITYSYQIDISFENEEAFNKFMEHPQRDEIINSMRQEMREGISDSLSHEVDRDFSGFYPEDQSSENMLTDGTIADLNFTGEQAVPTLNSIYGIDISTIEFNPQARETPGCHEAIKIDDPARAYNGVTTYTPPALGG